MTDWRQLQARIRRAKSGPDPLGKLTALFEKFRDGMVAYELGQIHEKSGATEEAGRWYVIAAERFRRADWKKKAQEALERLGIEMPASGNGVRAIEAELMAAAPQTAAAPAPEPAGEELAASEQSEKADEDAAAAEETSLTAAQAQIGVLTKKKRRRGRRGGRGRRKKKAGEAAQPAAGAPAGQLSQPTPRREARPEPRPAPQPQIRFEEPPPSSLEELSQLRARSADPGLASRVSRLEAQLRRLMAAPLHSPDDADIAPAGPGVFLLSDSDNITHYYVEACQTLRIGLGNLLRGRAGRGKGPSLKPMLAEELGIPESRVAKYLKDHCTVRWIQLDEGAAILAHFAIAVLRPRLNE